MTGLEGLEKDNPYSPLPLEYMDEEILEQFKEHGMTASYHYADDSTKEWDQGFKHSYAAQELAKQHPRLIPQMREIAKSFLWSFNPK